ncbi:hypothetical protein SYNPS1DRAFT_22337 [Syncephalis pseudoplumigaleata]|uniref:Uncharacterized protein n=1 Tax=Syncephalis pseudoplumigaleata TaxID=1712513 RepID=A0A4P9Z060_9FUNG|nr:hypothetical protein SYNPS1DRAFT_22337 [Syncephalis pseudoplumigaleata]|eukprot:RKP25764.1 hypothetical protein SYNPS1DRAFT_22337 [Syncephalis pseudoplumigaleata]
MKRTPYGLARGMLASAGVQTKRIANILYTRNGVAQFLVDADYADEFINLLAGTGLVYQPNYDWAAETVRPGSSDEVAQKAKEQLQQQAKQILDRLEPAAQKKILDAWRATSEADGKLRFSKEPAKQATKPNLTKAQRRRANRNRKSAQAQQKKPGKETNETPVKEVEADQPENDNQATTENTEMETESVEEGEIAREEPMEMETTETAEKEPEQSQQTAEQAAGKPADEEETADQTDETPPQSQSPSPQLPPSEWTLDMFILGKRSAPTPNASCVQEDRRPRLSDQSGLDLDASILGGLSTNELPPEAAAADATLNVKSLANAADEVAATVIDAGRADVVVTTETKLRPDSAFPHRYVVMASTVPMEDNELRKQQQGRGGVAVMVGPRWRELVHPIEMDEKGRYIIFAVGEWTIIGVYFSRQDLNTTDLHEALDAISDAVKKTIRQLVRHKKRTAYQEFMTELEDNSHADINTETVRATEEHFSKVFAGLPCDTDTQRRERQRLEQLTLPESDLASLTEALSEEEVRTTVRTMATKKAPGKDGISPELLKAAEGGFQPERGTLDQIASLLELQRSQTTEFLCRNGIQQGSSISPWLYTIFMNDLTESLTQPEEVLAMFPEDGKSHPIDVILQKINVYHFKDRRFRVVMSILSEVAYHDHKLNRQLYQHIANLLSSPPAAPDRSRRLALPYI